MEGLGSLIVAWNQRIKILALDLIECETKQFLLNKFEILRSNIDVDDMRNSERSFWVFMQQEDAKRALKKQQWFWK